MNATMGNLIVNECAHDNLFFMNATTGNLIVYEYAHDNLFFMNATTGNLTVYECAKTVVTVHECCHRKSWCSAT
jgi:hypothetical protein